MRVVHTVSGSIYEIDEDNKKVRRFGMSRLNDYDGEWRQYQDLVELPKKDGLLFIWEYKDNIAVSTLTSRLRELPVQ